MSAEWKSQRRIDEDIRNYQRKRFEQYMQMVDDGTLPREIGIAALRDEVESGLWIPNEREATADQNNQMVEG